MKKSTFLIATAILAAAGTLIATRSFVSATPAAPAEHRTIARAVSALTADMRPIVPAPVIDPKAEVFIGTGDGAGGAWTRP
jgi:hypothetical protein